MEQFRHAGCACNPYLPGKEHVPDAEPHVFGDRLYVFGSHDLLGEERYCAGCYVGWSAPVENPAEWRYEGVLLEKGEDPYDPDGTKDYYAPDVVQGADGRFYLYYSIEGSMVISVAVSDTPAGTYSFYGHVKDENGHVVGSAEGDDYQFDPAVLMDDDGVCYLYSGQDLPLSEVKGRKVKGAQVCRLKEDMLTIDGAQKVITSYKENTFRENPFFEASSIRKINGTYYFIYSPLPNTHLLCYAVSAFPDRDFSYRGVLVSNADIFLDDPNRQEPMNYWGNNHGSLLELNGQYYVFYHRNSNRTPYARQGCAEKITLKPDGSFAQAQMTSSGMSEKPLPSGQTYPAYIAWQLQKKCMQPFRPYEFLSYDEEDPYVCDEEQTELPFLKNIRDGSRAGFRYFSFSGMESTVSLTVRGSGTGSFQVRQNDRPVGTIPFSACSEWQTISGECNIRGEISNLCFVYQGDGAVDVLSWQIK